jgi:putative glycosyltransferase (TIGR04372 family)
VNRIQSNWISKIPTSAKAWKVLLVSLLFWGFPNSVQRSTFRIFRKKIELFLEFFTSPLGQEYLDLERKRGETSSRVHKYLNDGEYFQRNSELGDYFKQVVVNNACREVPTFLVGKSITGVFGHLATFSTVIIKNQIMERVRSPYVIFSNSNASNSHFIRSYMAQHIPILNFEDGTNNFLEELLKKFEVDIQILFVNGEWLPLEIATNQVEYRWTKEKKDKPLFHLLTSDKTKGYRYLRNLGYGTNDWFVVLHMRNNIKYDLHRNVDPKTYNLAINEIVSRGGWVFVIGESESSNALLQHSRVINYGTSKDRSEEIDIFLLSEARFMIGCSSGPLDLPPLFGRPVLWTNASRFGVNIFRPNSFALPKLIVSEQLKDASFKEFLHQGYFDVDHIRENSKAIEFRENSEHDILNGVKDMLEANFKRGTNKVQDVISQELRFRGFSPTTPVAPSFALNHQKYFLDS